MPGLLGDSMSWRRGWASKRGRDRANEKRKRWQRCWGGERRNICESRASNETSYESAGTSATHTHTHAVGMVAIPVFFVCVLSAPTHEPTYLSPLTCYVLCVREILARPLWFLIHSLGGWVGGGLCACVYAHTSVFLYPSLHMLSVSQQLTCPHLHPSHHYPQPIAATRALLSGLWIICSYPISNRPLKRLIWNIKAGPVHPRRWRCSMWFISHQELLLNATFRTFSRVPFKKKKEQKSVANNSHLLFFLAERILSFVRQFRITLLHLTFIPLIHIDGVPLLLVLGSVLGTIFAISREICSIFNVRP